MHRSTQRGGGGVSNLIYSRALSFQQVRVRASQTPWVSPGDPLPHSHQKEPGGSHLPPCHGLGRLPGLNPEGSDNLKRKARGVLPESRNRARQSKPPLAPLPTHRSGPAHGGTPTLCGRRSPTLNFLPSSSILYSVTVFMFPLMTSLGGGSGSAGGDST